MLFTWLKHIDKSNSEKLKEVIFMPPYTSESYIIRGKLYEDLNNMDKGIIRSYGVAYFEESEKLNQFLRLESKLMYRSRVLGENYSFNDPYINYLLHHPLLYCHTFLKV